MILCSDLADILCSGLADTQADLNLHWEQISEGALFNSAGHNTMNLRYNENICFKGFWH